jgi:hypothetical protein
VCASKKETRFATKIEQAVSPKQQQKCFRHSA